jgi:hypothetical protein
MEKGKRMEVRKRDIPDNKGLAPPAITRSEYTLDVSVVLARRGLDILARVLLDLISQDSILGA